MQMIKCSEMKKNFNKDFKDMNLLEKIITYLGGTMPVPQPFGWFHMMFLVLVVVFTVVFSLLFKNKSEKTIRIVVLSYALLCLIFELYKQLLFSYSPSTHTWSYSWYAFPFQLCSTPMYVAFIAGLVKKEKVQQSLYSYLATFGMLAGVMVMLIPGDVFISKIGINIQTMVHHGGQVFIGVFLLATRQVKIDIKTPLRALPTFIALVATALLLNLTMVNFTGGKTFNMFFISPYFPSTLPVFSSIYEKVPYIVFLLLYILALTLGAYLVTLLLIGIKKLTRKLKTRENTTAVKQF